MKFKAIKQKADPKQKRAFVAPRKHKRDIIKERFILIDGKDHLAGRLASIVAKQLLMGKRVVVVRCEKLNLSGCLYRNRSLFSY